MAHRRPSGDEGSSGVAGDGRAAESGAAAVEPVPGVYQGGVIRLERPLDLDPGTIVRLDVASVGAAATITGAVVGKATPARRWTAIALAAAGLLVFAATRLIGLTEFPIYFFTDEAIHPNWAAFLLAHGFRDPGGVLFPPFFKNDITWNLSASVYTHLLPVALFGRSVLVTRLVPALLSVVAAAGLTIASRRAFGHRWFWLTPLAMTVMPGWFLHSRTGFETALATSYYALFVMAYLLYRQERAHWILAALPLGAAAAYSYASAQILMAGTGVLLLVVDAPFHLEQFRKYPRVMLGTVALLLVLLAPYLRFRVLEPDATANHLKGLSSYLVADTPRSEKVGIFLRNYVDGIEPTYWFKSDHPRDIDRHRMKGWPAISTLLAPFIGIGLLVSLRRVVRAPAYRVVLVALLVGPVGAALVAPGVTRLLAMVVPATLLAAIGLDWVLQRLPGRRPAAVAAAVVAIALTANGALMTRAALRDGPTWYADYGIYGMQWGAPQLFGAIAEELARSPAARAVVSPTWANNPNAFVDFFLDADAARRVEMASIQSFLIAPLALDPNLVFVLPADEYGIARASDKLALDAPLRVIDHPDGKPGFYFFHARYVPDAAERFEADRQARLTLVESTVSFRGEKIAVRHSRLDMGDMRNVFDGDTVSLVRGLDANPFSVEVIFPSPRPLRTFAVTTGSMDMGLRVRVWGTSEEEPRTLEQTLRGLANDPRVEVPLPEPSAPVARVRVDITNLHDGDVSHVHLREVDWR